MALSARLLGDGRRPSAPRTVSTFHDMSFVVRANWNSKFEHFSHVSSQEYFAQLLSLHSLEWLRLPLLQGLATSAISGAEGLVRASRSALTQFLHSQTQAHRQKILMVFLHDFSTILSENLQDERFAIPAVEFIAFLVDSYILVIPEDSDIWSVNSSPNNLIQGLSTDT